MVYISLNIGYESADIGSGRSLNTTPIVFRYDTFKEFSNMIREEIFNIALWAHESYVGKSSLCLYLKIQEDNKEDAECDYWEWDFNIQCKNIREYKQYLKMTREEMDDLKVSNQRNDKLDDILNNTDEIHN